MFFTNDDDDDDYVAQIENTYKAHVTPQVKMQRCARIGSKSSHQAGGFLLSAKIGDRSFAKEFIATLETSMREPVQR